MGAILLAIFPFLLELLKVGDEIYNDKKSNNSQLASQRAEQVKKIAEGIIHRDSTAINDGYDALRRLRGK